MSDERESLWPDERISKEAGEATDELDGSMYVRHVISQLLVKMRDDYEAQLANQYQRIERFVELVDRLERKLAEATEANTSCTIYIASQMERIAELARELDEVTAWWQASIDRCADLEVRLVTSHGDDWATTVDYLISLAPEPEPPYDGPEPPEDWDDEDRPHYDTPGGY